jgi:hypothetical protein
MSTSTFAVFDGVFRAAARQAITAYIERTPTELVPLHDPGFTLDDGAPRRGPSVFVEVERHRASYRPKRRSTLTERITGYPTGTDIDRVLRKIVALATAIEPWVGMAVTDWRAVVARHFCYPRDSSLGWHDDPPPYTGAFAYYAHPSWRPQWGGELLVAVGEDEEADNHASGCGRFVGAAPNRLVVIKGGTPHRIARVSRLAGEHERMSISGFFVSSASLRAPGRGRLA